jgi:RHS repeat-associated protein
MTSLPGAPPASQYSLSFAYDGLGRRIQKIVSGWNTASNAYVPQYTNVYVYDGWNLIGVLTPQSSVVASMMWGLDLSGSLQGAGGVGGLLAENLAGNGAQFVCYDGAGNVSALVSATNGAVTATYEYGPFGELIRATGPTSKLNEVMYQSQICDWESGKYYWKHRYYDTSTGRWLNHDPIAESGGLNMYGFVGNNPMNFFDAFGFAPDGGYFDPFGHWHPTFCMACHDPTDPNSKFYKDQANLANLLDYRMILYQQGMAAVLSFGFGAIAEDMAATPQLTEVEELEAQTANLMRTANRVSKCPKPTLQRIHPLSTYQKDREAAASLQFWRTQPTDKILESLKPGNPESLRTWLDGRMMNGNTRTLVLEERNFPINSLPREVKLVDPDTGAETWVILQ